MTKVNYHKPPYIRKYDYLRSFYQPSNEWFTDSEEINKLLHELIENEAGSNQTISIVDIDFDEESNSEENEIDSYEYLKEKQEMSNSSIDDNLEDAKIVEGRIIDQLAKKFLSQKYSNCQPYDLDNEHLSNEEGFKRTKQIISSNKNFIIFQPVFIISKEINKKTIKAIAKPDALIRIDDVYTLIEVKGTSSSKIIHWLDLNYQRHIVNTFLETIDKSIDHFKLCIIKYEKCKAHDCSFVLVDGASFSKTGVSIPSEVKKISSYGKKIDVKARIKELIDDTSLDLDTNGFDYVLVKGYKPSFKKNNGKISKSKAWSILKEEILEENKFWERVLMLYEFIPNSNLKPNFEPCHEYKSQAKNSDYWMSIRDYYFFSKNPNYFLFKFSGNLLNYHPTIELNNNYLGNIDILYANKSFLFNGEKILNHKDEFLKYFNSIYLNQDTKNPKIYFVEKNVKNFFNTISRPKCKKVYFDFESINLATRVIDDIPPFTQIVNQVSTVIDHGDNNLDIKPYLVIDPLKGTNGRSFNKEDFKLIIDHILPNPNNLEESKQYKYIVYNKSFECTRLKEINNYLCDPEYEKKIKIINDNIFDLADLFTIKKGKTNAIIFRELYGFYSIKKVLPLVEKYDPDSFKETHCKNYKTQLEIQNGSQAQDCSSLRFFNKILDKDWQKKKIQLGEYCNNDVLAMIAIEYFVKKLIDNKLKLK